MKSFARDQNFLSENIECGGVGVVFTRNVDKTFSIKGVVASSIKKHSHNDRCENENKPSFGFFLFKLLCRLSNDVI
jgi:hypothetical protein